MPVISDEELIDDILEEVKEVDKLSEAEMEAAAKEAIARSKGKGKYQKAPSPMAREAQKERERRKRKLRRSIYDRFETLGLQVNDDGSVTKKT